MKVRTKMHCKWCRIFIGTGVDIWSRSEISEVVMKEGMGEGGIITRMQHYGVTYQPVTAVFIG